MLTGENKLLHQHEVHVDRRPRRPSRDIHDRPARTRRLQRSVQCALRPGTVHNDVCAPAIRRLQRLRDDVYPRGGVVNHRCTVLVG